jgi:hypothetical protein
MAVSNIGLKYLHLNDGKLATSAYLMKSLSEPLNAYATLVTMPAQAQLAQIIEAFNAMYVFAPNQSIQLASKS